MSGAKDGDLVRATTDVREAESVEGILRLRYVPSRDYVQVHVRVDAGWVTVDPATVEIVAAGEEVVADDELVDPLRGEPGWRRVTDLDVAIAEGLVATVHKRLGGTWADMAARVRRLAQPLVDAGWTVGNEDRDSSSEFGDSVFLDLDRADLAIQLELYEDDALVVYDLNTDEDDDDLGWSSALFGLNEATQESCRAAFAERGWLDSA